MESFVLQRYKKYFNASVLPERGTRATVALAIVALVLPGGSAIVGAVWLYRVTLRKAPELRRLAPIAQNRIRLGAGGVRRLMRMRRSPGAPTEDR
jgi:hypothetical protein